MGGCRLEGNPHPLTCQRNQEPVAGKAFRAVLGSEGAFSLNSEWTSPLSCFHEPDRVLAAALQASPSTWGVTSRKDYPVWHLQPVSRTGAVRPPQESGQRTAHQGAALTVGKHGTKSTLNNNLKNSHVCIKQNKQGALAPTDIHVYTHTYTRVQSYMVTCKYKIQVREEV